MQMKELQRHIAWSSVGPTTLRKMLPKGWRKIVCPYLETISLGELVFIGLPDTLNCWTTELAKNLASDLGDGWGPARKAVNLFLRDTSYNYWTRKKYKFEDFEQCLEVPLDGKVMKEIRRKSDENLPVVAVKYLTLEISNRYQEAANLIAADMRTDRVHLDLKWWARQADDEDA